jgi:ribosomal protein S25
MLITSKEAETKRENFFRIVFGDYEGYVCIAHRKTNKGSFGEHFFLYPAEIEPMSEYITARIPDHDMWFSPMLYRGNERKKDQVAVTTCLWSDLDTCAPEKLLVEPTILIKSSPGRWQGLWKIEDEVEPAAAEGLSKKIAYHHADDGADRSGWDLTQLLRIPFTYNYKYESSLTPPTVIIESVNNAPLMVSTFDIYPASADYTNEEFDYPTELPFADGDAALAFYKTRVHPNVWPLYQIPPEGDWSKALWQLEMILFDSELTREEVFLIARDAACNKYRRDGRSDKLLWRDVCRAYSKSKSSKTIILSPNQDKEPTPLLTPEEQEVAEKDVTLVEEYIEWAKTLGDAAWQYHEAGAFIILSSLLSGSVKLPTSFGIVTPNLWFMILADTTLTRKTTAMDIAMDMLIDIDPDCILATDGSIEGLFTSLSYRPNRASVFLRDEFSGLLEAMTKKDYMAGMAETLTKLYDGKYQKRILRKDIIEVKDPILITFAGGIRSKIEQLLQFEHVASGFIPRFLFVTALSDQSKLQPLGPPTERTLGNRVMILDKFRTLYASATQGQTVNVGGQAVVTAGRHEAQLTEDAWLRYNKLETDLVDLGLRSTMPEILMPMMDRLAKSGLKASVLIAASRGINGSIVVTEKDMIKAIWYVNKWRDYAIQIIRNIGVSAQERLIENVYKAIVRNPNILRSTIMQNYHLTKRDADVIMQTLEERGLITGVSHGRSVRYTPIKYEGK